MIQLRRIAGAAASLCLMLPLAACHGSTSRESFAVPEQFDTSRDFEITFWAKNDTNKNQTDIYNQAISDFESLYPNIHINIRLYTDYGKIYNDVITNIATGTTPNVCITYPDHIATYLTGENVVVPLDDLLENAAYGLGGSELLFEGPGSEGIVEEFLEEGVINGSQYAVPYMRSTEACYINQTYVEQLGYEIPDILTWDWIWEVSEAAAEKNADGTYALNGQKVMIPFIYKSTDNMMIHYLKQSDAPYSDESGEMDLYHETTEDFLKTISAHTAAGAFSTFKISGYPANFLNAGQCVFAIDSTAGSTWMGSGAPLLDIAADKVVNFQTAVRAVPQVNPDSPSMISQGPSICIFNKTDEQEVLASWLFTQYLLDNEVQLPYAQTEGYVPVTVRAQTSAEYQTYLNHEDDGSGTWYSVKLEATKLLLDNISNTFTTPVFNGSASLRDAAGSLIESVTKSTRRKETIDEAYFTKLYSDTTALYRLDQIQTSDTSGTKKELGELPGASKALIGTLVVTWVILGVIAFVKQKKRKKS